MFGSNRPIFGIGNRSFPRTADRMRSLAHPVSYGNASYYAVRHLPLHIKHIFVAVEISDAALSTVVASAACSTWMSDFVHAHFFSDTADALLAPACQNFPRHACCGNETMLGRYLVSAQKKREKVLAGLGPWLPAEARWIIATELDTWWHAPRLLSYLSACEALLADPAMEPAVSGAMHLGPFIMINQPFWAVTYANATWLNACIATYMTCHKLKKNGIPLNESAFASLTVPKAMVDCKFVYQSAPKRVNGIRATYNNDHLTWFCSRPFVAGNVHNLEMHCSVAPHRWRNESVATWRCYRKPSVLPHVGGAELYFGFPIVRPDQLWRNDGEVSASSVVAFHVRSHGLGEIYSAPFMLWLQNHSFPRQSSRMETNLTESVLARLQPRAEKQAIAVLRAKVLSLLAETP